MDSVDTRNRPITWPKKNETNVFEGALWMVAITLALFFLPAINGLIGGFVGGYKVGTVGRALMAAILPAIVVAIGLWVLLILFDLPLVGFIASAAIGFVILLSDLGIFIGAAIGGALGGKRPT